MSDNNPTLGSDSRAVSEVLGSVLVFGLALALVVILQTAAIPQANAQVEFKHNERVQGDMAQLAETTSRVAATGASSSVGVKTGVQYPTRVIFLNPPPVSGSVSTKSLGQVSIENVRSTNDETDDYIDGSLGSFDTNSVNYSVNYNEYSGGPTTVYEGGVLYNSYDDGAVTVADEGDVVSGNRINLVIIEGQFFQSKVGATSVGIDPLSAPAQTVSVSNTTGGNVTITVPSNVDAATWEDDILADEMIDRGGNIVDVRDDSGDIKIELKGDVTYELRMAKLGIGSGTTEPGPRYITTANSNTRVINLGQTTELTAQVRDKFNNPASNATVTFRSGNGTFSNGKGVIEVETDEDGLVTAEFTPNVSRAVNVTAQRDFNNSGDIEPLEKTNFTVQTFDPTAAANNNTLGNQLNPNNPGAVILIGADLAGSNCTSNSECEVDVTFRNKGGNDANIESMRFNFYFATAISSGTGGGVTGRNLPRSVVIEPSSGPELERTGPFVNNSAVQNLNEIPAGDQEPYRFEFKEQGGGGTYSVVKGDFFVISITFEDGRTGTYFVAPE